MSDHLTYHQKFSPEELEAQYNLRLGRPDFEETVLKRWIALSKVTRASSSATLDIRYADGPKQMMDVFSCGEPDSATLVYIHGGYWKSGDKSIYGFLAEPFLSHGVNVAIVGYDLCPDVSVTHISEEAREALAYLWQHSTELGLNQDRICVMGHSAGGHITEMMMGTRWSVLGGSLPDDLIKVGIPISPLSFLEPVRLTEGLNTGIRMDAVEAKSQSPMINHPPLTDAPQLVVVGGAETDEFHRQARMYVEAFGTADRSIELFIVPDVDHFDELNVLADPDSEFFQKTLTLLKQA